MSPLRTLLAAAAAACLAMPALAAPSSRSGGVVFNATPGDPAAGEIKALVPDAKAQVERFFGKPFAEPVRVTLAPDRPAFNAVFPKAWGMDKTECWMVGVGVADFLALLSPADWAKEACDHDARDAWQVRAIVVHELVHMYHGQRNPTRDFTGADDIGWFVEGLAVHVSGQLGHDRMSDPAEAIRNGAAPAALAKAWSGKYRYGVSGSLVAYIDATYGRKTIIALLPAVTQAEILGMLGLTEAELLERWKAWVLARAPTSPR